MVCTARLKSMISAQFVESVLALKPRIAVFDCDGTLWTNNSGEDFFFWSMEQGLVSPEVEKWARGRYDEYRRGRVEEGPMCGEMTTMYAGRTVVEMESAAARFLDEVVKPNHFDEMRKLTLALREQQCELWAVSSTNEWVVREGAKDFGIAGDHILAATAECRNGTVTRKLAQMPSGAGKAEAIKRVIQQGGDSPAIDAVFGNSIHDAAMLHMARRAFAINPNQDLEQIARAKGWTVYWPERVRVSSGVR